MKRKLVGATVASALISVACGAGATPAPSSTSSTPDVVETTIAATTAPTTSTAPSTSSSTTSTPAPTTTIAPTVTCDGIGTMAGTQVPTVTYTQDGYLWVLGIDSIHCVKDLPDRLAIMAYSWAPGGDKVLFADGTLFGPGIERPPIGDIAAGLGWTRPTGTSTIHVAPDGSLTKASSESVFAESRLTPLETHDSVAYHPDGTTFAVAGSDGIDQGIYISKNDGTGPQPLALSDVGVVITEMLFTNDARWLVFVADHTADDFQDGYHVHSVFTEPFELEDGTAALGSAAEFGGSTHLVSDVPVDDIVLPPSGFGSLDSPGGIAIAQGACGPERRALYLPDLGEETEPVMLLDAPGSPVGFLFSDPGEARVLVATSADGCTGPFDLHEVILDLTSHATSIGIQVFSVDAAAVHFTAPTVDITLSGVVIEPFA